MPWKDGYTITDEKTMDDQDITWPNNNQCAVMVVVDLSVPSGADGIGPKEVAHNRAEFGAEVGIGRVLDLLDRHNMRATFAVPAIIAGVYHDTVCEIIKRGHEIAAHGYCHEDVNTLDKQEEERRIQISTEVLADICGERPSGWFALPRQQDPHPSGSVSLNTVDLLIDAGYAYLGNSMADDIPHYWVTDFTSKRNILALPYYYHFDDLFFFDFPPLGTGSNCENPEALFQNWKQEFDAQYQRGRCFHMVVHPYLVGWSHRLVTLDDIFSHIQTVPLVWNPTGNECTQYWTDRYPSDRYLNLEESIWTDYPGSLS